MPFGETVVVFKVADKMFALASLDEVPTTVNLKCDPDLALELRDRYEQVSSWLSHEQKALEHGRDRQGNSGNGAAQNGRPLLRVGGEEASEGDAEETVVRLCQAPFPKIAVSQRRPTIRQIPALVERRYRRKVERRQLPLQRRAVQDFSQLHFTDLQL